MIRHAELVKMFDGHIEKKRLEIEALEKELDVEFISADSDLTLANLKKIEKANSVALNYEKRLVNLENELSLLETQRDDLEHEGILDPDKRLQLERKIMRIAELSSIYIKYKDLLDQIVKTFDTTAKIGVPNGLTPDEEKVRIQKYLETAIKAFFASTETSTEDEGISRLSSDKYYYAVKDYILKHSKFLSPELPL